MSNVRLSPESFRDWRPIQFERLRVGSRYGLLKVVDRIECGNAIVVPVGAFFVKVNGQEWSLFLSQEQIDSSLISVGLYDFKWTVNRIEFVQQEHKQMEKMFARDQAYQRWSLEAAKVETRVTDLVRSKKEALDGWLTRVGIMHGAAATDCFFSDSELSDGERRKRGFERIKMTKLKRQGMSQSKSVQVESVADFVSSIESVYGDDAYVGKKRLPEMYKSVREYDLKRKRIEYMTDFERDNERERGRVENMEEIECEDKRERKRERKRIESVDEKKPTYEWERHRIVNMKPVLLKRQQLPYRIEVMRFYVNETRKQLNLTEGMSEDRVVNERIRHHVVNLTSEQIEIINIIVFNEKKDILIHNIKLGKYFEGGVPVWILEVTEWQERGRPHAHIVI